MGPAGTESLLVVVGGVKVKPSTSRSLVVPAEQTSEHWLRLNNLDRVVNPTFSSAIFFYDNLLIRSDRSLREIVESLKESLSRVLVHFYPLAGRLELREDGLVDLHCNDQGAVFVEASLDAELTDVERAQPMPALSGLDIAKLGPGPQYIPDQLTPIPVLVVQVTQFRKCGSVALAVNWHHTVADGSSGCHFMQSWAEVAIGKNLTLKPDHSRELLMPRTPLNSSLVNGYSTKSVQEFLPRAAKVITEPALLKSFPLTKQAVQGLKGLAKTQACEYTSAEAISGYLWRLMTRARIKNVGDEDDEQGSSEETTRFYMFVDGRKRMGLPAGYFGNVVSSACAVSSEEDILKKPLSYAADLISKSTRNITGEYFRSLIDWVEEQRLAPSKSDHVNSLGHDVAATFWTLFPLYDLDFGWGKASFAARNAGPRPFIDGIAMLPSPEGSGHMVALLNLHADRMTRLQRDPAFSLVLGQGAGACTMSSFYQMPTYTSCIMSIAHQLGEELQRVYCTNCDLAPGLKNGEHNSVGHLLKNLGRYSALQTVLLNEVLFAVYNRYLDLGRETAFLSDIQSCVRALLNYDHSGASYLSGRGTA